MVKFINAHRDGYGVEPICAVLPIAPATYHAHKAREADASRVSARVVHDDGLKTEIRRVWTEHHGVYGSRKVWRHLKREGFAVVRCTVECLMRELNLQGAVRGRRFKSTIPDDAADRPQDLVEGNFTATRPNPGARCVGAGSLRPTDGRGAGLGASQRPPRRRRAGAGANGDSVASAADRGVVATAARTRGTADWRATRWRGPHCRTEPQKHLRHRLLTQQSKTRLSQIDRHLAAVDAEIGKQLAEDVVLARRTEIDPDLDPGRVEHHRGGPAQPDAGTRPPRRQGGRQSGGSRAGHAPVRRLAGPQLHPGGQAAGAAASLHAGPGGDPLQP